METGRRVIGRQGDRETGDRDTWTQRDRERERDRERDMEMSISFIVFVRKITGKVHKNLKSGSLVMCLWLTHDLKVPV